MADGGQTVDQWHLVDLAARRLARALGTGYGWAPLMQEARIEEPGSEVLDQSCVLAIAKRGRVIEQAAKSIDGCRHVRRQHRWSTSRTVVTIPSYRHDTEAIAALSFAKLDGPLGAILLLYATGDVSRYWPLVERYGLAVRSAVFAKEALMDAMARVICLRRSEMVPLDVRAKMSGVRASTYREEVRQCKAVLMRWLERAACRYMHALGN